MSKSHVHIPHEPSEPAESPGQPHHWTEILAVVLFGVATVATAWCAFQASVWSGEQTFRLAEASVADRRHQEAVLRQGLAHNLDVELFMKWSDAELDGQPQRAKIYERSFSPALARAFAQWRKERRPGEYGHPFDLPAYRPAQHDEIARLGALSRQNLVAADHANRNGDHYVLATVLFASVLFLSGTARLFHGPVQAIVLVPTAGVFVAAAIWLLAMPMLWAARAVSI